MKLFDFWTAYVLLGFYTFGAWILDEVDRRAGLGWATVVFFACSPFLIPMAIVCMFVGLLGFPFVAVISGFIEERRRSA